MADIELSTADAATLTAIRDALGAPSAALTLRFPDDEVSPPSPVLPAKADRQEMLLGFATGGAPEEVDPTTVGGGGSMLTPPVLANFAWVNQGVATAADVAADGFVTPGMTLKTPSGTAGLALLVKALPVSEPWVYRARIQFAPTAANFCHCGIVLRASGSGNLRCFGLRYDSAVWKFQRLYYVSSTTFSALDAGITAPNPGGAFQRTWDIKLTNNGTNVIGEVSPDGGVTWTQFISESKSNYFTPDQFGFYVERATGSPGFGSQIHVVHLSQS